MGEADQLISLQHSRCCSFSHNTIFRMSDLAAENAKLKEQLDRAVNILKRQSERLKGHNEQEVVELRRKLEASEHRAQAAEQRADRLQAELESLRATRTASQATPQYQNVPSARPEMGASMKLDSLLDELGADVAVSGGATQANSAPPNDSSAQLDAILDQLADDKQYMSLPTANSHSTQPTRMAPSWSGEGTDAEHLGDEPLKIAPGRSAGIEAVHKADVGKILDEKDVHYKFDKGLERKPSPGFAPKNDTVVSYKYVDDAQLQADIYYLRTLLSNKAIDLPTFNAQRDHMLIQKYGGASYGAQFTSHPNFKGRTTDPEAEELMRAFKRDELDMNGNYRPKFKKKK